MDYFGHPAENPPKGGPRKSGELLYLPEKKKSRKITSCSCQHKHDIILLFNSNPAFERRGKTTAEKAVRFFLGYYAHINNQTRHGKNSANPLDALLPAAPVCAHGPYAIWGRADLGGFGQYHRRVNGNIFARDGKAGPAGRSPGAEKIAGKVTEVAQIKIGKTNGQKKKPARHHREKALNPPRPGRPSGNRPERPGRPRR